ncbi:hypothetical protein ACP70R_029301 [Stipagrostis hirtigluma subsp. patula]
MITIRRRRKVSSKNSKRNSGDMLSIWNFDAKIAVQYILDAAETFDEKYCIGVGGYGSVFRAQLEGRGVLAVKLLHTVEDCTDEKTFHAEIEVWIKIRHRCLEEQHAKKLGWSKRFAIVRDTAQALSYWHHDCNEPIIHRDIKSSNILLDRDLRLMSQTLGWTCAYIAPEQLTKLKDIMDQRIVPTSEEEKDFILIVLVAFACLKICPRARSTMLQVYQALINRSCPTAILKPLP